MCVKAEKYGKNTGIMPCMNTCIFEHTASEATGKMRNIFPVLPQDAPGAAARRGRQP